MEQLNSTTDAAISVEERPFKGRVKAPLYHQGALAPEFRARAQENDHRP